MDVVGLPDKQLRADAYYYYVMINEHMTCLTLNRLQKYDARTGKHKILIIFTIMVSGGAQG